jgi:hypothetical protein
MSFQEFIENKYGMTLEEFKRQFTDLTQKEIEFLWEEDYGN